MKKLLLPLGICFLLLAEDKVDEAATARMGSEELEHSQIMPR
jgi:hypothetical protein